MRDMYKNIMGMCFMQMIFGWDGVPYISSYVSFIAPGQNWSSEHIVADYILARWSFTYGQLTRWCSCVKCSAAQFPTRPDVEKHKHAKCLLRAFPAERLCFIQCNLPLCVCVSLCFLWICLLIPYVCFPCSTPAGFLQSKPNRKKKINHSTIFVLSR